MRVGIINNGIGNLGSVLSALAFYKYRVSLLDSPKGIEQCDVLVLAGVGSFHSGVSSLRDKGFWEKLDEAVRVHEKPVLGLCLGMHLFASKGYEDGESAGFGWIPGKVIRLNGEGAKVPHIGWEKIDCRESKIFKGFRYGSFYFMHSFHFVPDDPETIIATVPYGNQSIVTGVRIGNIIGFQFHPEKSQGDGLRLLRNVMEEFV